MFSLEWSKRCLTLYLPFEGKRMVYYRVAFVKPEMATRVVNIKR
jgi:hypothetical protein